MEFTGGGHLARNHPTPRASRHRRRRRSRGSTPWAGRRQPERMRDMADARPESSPPVPPVQPLTTRKPWLVVGVSRATFKRLQSAGKAPGPIDVGTSHPVWRVSDLERWVESRKPDRRVRKGPKRDAADPAEST